MLSRNQAPKSPKFIAHRSLLIAPPTPLSHSPSCLANRGANHGAESRAGYWPDYLAGSWANYWDGYSAEYGGDNLPENGESNSPRCWDSNSPRYSAESSGKHPGRRSENSRANSRADSWADSSGDCGVNSWANYGENYRPSAAFRPLSAALHRNPTPVNWRASITHSWPLCSFIGPMFIRMPDWVSSIHSGTIPTRRFPVLPNECSHARTPSSSGAPSTVIRTCSFM